MVRPLHIAGPQVPFYRFIHLLVAWHPPLGEHDQDQRETAPQLPACRLISFIKPGAINDHQPPARPQNPLPFSNCLFRLGKGPENIPVDHSIEGAIIKGQNFAISLD